MYVGRERPWPEWLEIVRVREHLEQFAAAGVSRVYLRHNETHGRAWIERVAQELAGRIG